MIAHDVSCVVVNNFHRRSSIAYRRRTRLDEYGHWWLKQTTKTNPPVFLTLPVSLTRGVHSIPLLLFALTAFFSLSEKWEVAISTQESIEVRTSWVNDALVLCCVYVVLPESTGNRSEPRALMHRILCASHAFFWYVRMSFPFYLWKWIINANDSQLYIN